MMLGFVEVFRTRHARLIYADTAHGCIEEISSDGSAPMTHVLDVPSYLFAQDINFDRADSDDLARLQRIDHRAPLTRFIGEHAVSLQAGIKIMNGIIAKAIGRDMGAREDRLLEPSFELAKGAWGDFAKLLTRCNEYGLLVWQQDAKQGRLVDLDAARYLAGGWLEEYAWLCANSVEPFDVRMGVHRAGETDEEINEFDLLVVHFNQLLYVECKTANYLKQLAKANQDAYKVDSLGRRARGLFGETWLLSAIEPPSELLVRAKDMRIRVIGPTELRDLRGLMAAWMRKNA
jgi:hypothetical protein